MSDVVLGRYLLAVYSSSCGAVAGEARMTSAVTSVQNGSCPLGVTEVEYTRNTSKDLLKYK